MNHHDRDPMVVDFTSRFNFRLANGKGAGTNLASEFCWMKRTRDMCHFGIFSGVLPHKIIEILLKYYKRV